MQVTNVQSPKIKLIRPMLTEDATKTILLGTFISHLDYVNIAAKLVMKKSDRQCNRMPKMSSLAPNQILD